MQHTAAVAIASLAIVAILLPAGAAAQSPAAATRSSGGAALAVGGDEPAFSPDRPGFSDSPDVVGRGVFQIESGVTVARDSAAPRLTRVVAPQVWLRYGMSRRSEVRLGADGVIAQHWRGAADSPGSARSDLTVAAKYALAVIHGVSLAVVPGVSLPTGDATVTSGGVDPSVKLAWARPLRGVTLGGNVNVAATSGADERTRTRAASVLVSRAVGRVGTYGHVYVQSDGHSRTSTLEGGVTRRLGDHMQADLEIGHGLTTASPDWYVGVGFAVRRLGH